MLELGLFASRIPLWRRCNELLNVLRFVEPVRKVLYLVALRRLQRFGDVFVHTIGLQE